MRLSNLTPAVFDFAKNLYIENNVLIYWAVISKKEKKANKSIIEVNLEENIQKNRCTQELFNKLLTELIEKFGREALNITR